MNTILAAVMPGAGRPLEFRELPEPELEDGAALLAVELSEVCGTDVHLLHSGLSGVPYPIIPGHVSLGRLEKILGQVLDVHGKPLEEGDRVTFLDVHRTCNACWYCLVAKATTRCPHRKVYGITYGVQDGLTGGWARKIHLKPGVRIIRLPDVDAERFMAGGCAVPTALHAVERAGIDIGDSVLILGSGPVGLSAVAFARMRGALQVSCIGAPSMRLEAARAMGAGAVLDIASNDPEARGRWVREQTAGRGADVTIEATGDPEAVVQAFQYTRDAGRVVVVGQYTDHGDTSFNPHLQLNRKHLDVLGCWGSDFSHFHRGAQVLSHPELSRPWAAIKSDRYALSHADEALEAVAAGQVIKALIDPAL